MTQEEKQLLLKDLCARLPYNVMISVNNGKYVEDTILRPTFIIASNYWYIKPYLRPLSNMTEEEAEEYNDLVNELSNYDCQPGQSAGKMINWLNAHHFDYRGLIERGLALEAPKNMYVI